MLRYRMACRTICDEELRHTCMSLDGTLIAAK